MNIQIPRFVGKNAIIIHKIEISFSTLQCACFLRSITSGDIDSKATEDTVKLLSPHRIYIKFLIMHSALKIEKNTTKINIFWK